MVQSISFYAIQLTSCRTIWGNLTGYVHTFPNLGLRDCALQFGYDFALWAVRFSISLRILRVVNNSSLFSSSIKFLVVRIIGFEGSICKFFNILFLFSYGLPLNLLASLLVFWACNLAMSRPRGGVEISKKFTCSFIVISGQAHSVHFGISFIIACLLGRLGFS